MESENNTNVSPISNMTMSKRRKQPGKLSSQKNRDKYLERIGKEFMDNFYIDILSKYGMNPDLSTTTVTIPEIVTSIINCETTVQNVKLARVHIEYMNEQQIISPIYEPTDYIDQENVPIDIDLE